MNTIEIRDISEKYFDETIPQNYKESSTTIGSGTNGVVTVLALDDISTTKKIKVVTASGNSKPLSAAFVSGLLTITLGTNSSGVADDTKNTATLVAEVINTVDGFSAIASGTGATVIPTVSQKSFTAGQNGTPCPMVGLAFVKIVSGTTTYYVATDGTINTEQNKAWKSFTLTDM
jgi:hypothetical protein